MSNVHYAMKHAIDSATGLWKEQQAALGISGDSYWSDEGKEIRRAVRRNKAEEIKMVRKGIVEFYACHIGAQLRDMTADELFYVLDRALFGETVKLDKRAASAIGRLADKCCDTNVYGRVGYVKEFRDVIAAYNGMRDAISSLHGHFIWRNDDRIKAIREHLDTLEKDARQLLEAVDHAVAEGIEEKTLTRIKE